MFLFKQKTYITKIKFKLVYILISVFYKLRMKAKTSEQFQDANSKLKQSQKARSKTKKCNLQTYESARIISIY